MPNIAVVTGGASGIGRAVVERLAAGGVSVALLDLNAEAAKAVERDLTAAGRTVRAYQTDITSPESVAATQKRLVEELGQPNVIVNCAGWSVIEPFMKNDAGFWKRAIDINLMGTIFVTRTFLDGMIAEGGGSVVNVASDAGRVGSTGEVVYSAAKGGVISFSKALAREMVKHRIRVNCVCPGPTATPMLMTQDPARIEALTKAVPMRRLAQPDDIAVAVEFFASPSTAYITGQVLSVSGGLTMSG